MLLGGGGRDRLIGGEGDDDLQGGAESDQVLWFHTEIANEPDVIDGSDLIDGGTGTDRIVVVTASTDETFSFGTDATHLLLKRTTPQSFALDVVDVEELATSTGDGADTLNVKDLSDAVVAFARFDVGGVDNDDPPDFAPDVDDGKNDSILIHATGGTDDVTINSFTGADGEPVIDVAGLHPHFHIGYINASDDRLRIKSDGGDDNILVLPEVESHIAVTVDVPELPLVVSRGFGDEPIVSVYDWMTHDKVMDIMAYDPSFRSGVQVATADVNGDGVADIITAPGPGGGPHIKVFDGASGRLLREFRAYDRSFTGGVFVAAADLDGDGKADIITAPDAGGGPQVRVFSGANGRRLASFFAYDRAFTGGVHIAAGDIDGDGDFEIVTGPGRGGGPQVRVFDLAGVRQQQIMAYAADFTGGVYVAAGDVDGDNRDDIITGAGADGGPQVRVFSGADGHRLASFFAYQRAFTGGVRVGAGDLDNDGRADILTGAGRNGGPHVRAFDGDDFTRLANFFAFEHDFTGGLFVAGSDATGGNPLRASSLGNGGTAVSQEELDAIVATALSLWEAESCGAAASLSHLKIRVSDLPDTYLGLSYPDLVLIDTDAAGHGWFVDPSPDSNDDLDQSRVDLLTAVLHELGHVLDLEDTDANLLMSGVLSPGIRHLPGGV